MTNDLKSGLTSQNSCKSEDNMEKECSNIIPEQLFCVEDNNKNSYVCKLYYPLSDKCPKLTMNIKYFNQQDSVDGEPSGDITSIFAHVVSIGRKKYVFSLFYQKLNNRYPCHLLKDNYTCCLISLDKDGFCSDLCDFRLWHKDAFIFSSIQDYRPYNSCEEESGKVRELEENVIILLKELQEEGVELPVAGIGDVFQKVGRGILKTLEYVAPGGQVQLAKDIVKLIIDKTTHKDN